MVIISRASDTNHGTSQATSVGSRRHPKGLLARAGEAGSMLTILPSFPPCPIRLTASCIRQNGVQIDRRDRIAEVREQEPLGQQPV